MELNFKSKLEFYKILGNKNRKISEYVYIEFIFELVMKF